MPDLHQHTLPNGLTLLLEPDPDAQTIAAGYFVNTGSREETPQDMGASHFIEHLLFKGSDELSARELNERLDDLGGHANAFTSEEATVYHAATLPEHTPELLHTLTELMRPALRDTDIHTERGVILEEIAMYADQPSVRVTDQLRADYWGDHPLGQPILGTTDTVTNVTPQTLRAHHHARYGARRVTLAVTGQFDPHHLTTWAQQHLHTWPTGTPTPHPDTRPPAWPDHTHTLTDPDLTRVHLAATSPGLSAHHPLREAAHVLADLIGGENGALYWTLIDTGTCDSADLAHLEYQHTGTFEGGFTSDPDRAPQALATYRQVLADAHTLITPQAVRRAARKLAVSTLLRAETPQGRLFTLGMEYLATGRTLSTDDLVKRYENVTVRDVQEVLRLCPMDRLTVVALGPIAEL
ncbi:pitrilysin family protein [Deinococcus soli (ex Cha et al. 2016)]|uniref:Zn-dependent peptidase n=2 Tax=Deinococcus soli (ex Cha et al. 2016) TaxID=1309411 RepID=A0ACC6KI48_9DEIO|nr:pitrilysin family protein [Deinococcus soli (ex Cha et al. 2016)]MDR6219199.1 putative Zn-dependent peptidase [Deinococcus soli (ex Cha et al. 2016)]MDR6329448.1 putative Zn-dependent peptidase [Deinococcus soli (ex Cha et al. 2016)]MDR6752108.1 putative Zn-dependent peptidase [Deinococcus soli (ex Cha et al. 2016)]